MKKLILGSILIFVLIAVSWFTPAYCDALSNNDILKKYKGSELPGNLGDSVYTTPDIFGERPESKLPRDTVVQEYDNQSAGRVDKVAIEKEAELQPFGYDLFNSPSELTTPPDVASVDSYVLGPGDNILIYLWGKVEKEYNLTVDRQGKIFIPKVGEIVVWGITLSEFKENVSGKLHKAYSDFKMSVSIGKIRSIRIYLTGEVKKPGAYTVSSLTTLFNALYLAGGPNQRGSMREIKLMRNNRVETTVDLYKFLLKGESESDVRLSSGDAIFVPVAGPRASIQGEVKRPAIYELKGDERVSDLLEVAGGTKAEAYLDRIMLDRISTLDERQMFDLNINRDDSEQDNLILKDGDELTVFSIYDIRRNVVAVAGMVKHPGYFERNDSTTIKSLLNQSEILPENVYLERANLFRHNPDQTTEIIPINLNYVNKGLYDISLNDMDSLHIYSIEEVTRKSHVYIDGEVKKPGKYDYFENMTVYDLVFLAGNLNREAYMLSIELARSDQNNQIHLQKLDLTDEAQARTRLQEDDRLFIRRMPDWFRHRIITIEGEVMFPGQYALVSQNESFYDLINRAGGFTKSAFPRGTIFRRNTIGESLARQNMDEIIASSQPLQEDSLGNIRQLNMLRFNPENLNRIIIDIDEIMRSNGSSGNIYLQHDDYIFVPPTPSGISVMGAVSANGTIKFNTNKNVKYYIKRAGNFSQQADTKHTRLVKADGQVFSGNGTLGKKVELGDVIVVPSEIKKDRNWLKTLSTTVSIIGGLATTAFIIDKL